MIKREDTGRAWRNPGVPLCSLAPTDGHRAHSSSPQQRKAATCAQCFCPGEPCRDSAPKVSAGAGPAGTVCTAGGKIPDPTGEQCPAQTRLHKASGQSKPPSGFRARFRRHAPWLQAMATPQVDSSKASSPRPAKLPLFYTPFISIRALLHLLRFADTVFFFSLQLARLVAILHTASLSVPFFSKAFAHFMSLCHILVILAIFQTFIIICYGDLWWVIFDVTTIIGHFLAIKYF